jgi:hypothetical protein
MREQTWLWGGVASLRLNFAVTQAPRRGGGKRRGPEALGAELGTLYMQGMQKAAIILPLVAFLAASVWFAYYVWASDSGPPMPASGYVAMALGVVFSLVVGIGLMALVFYSSRHGYDDTGQGGSQD